ncbi:heterochromatin protein 1 [Folsomia candida]|uniref:Heterochromatin protein 1 n=1 Tax=Folsomia candida TaxID=158441 RepID=A0A226D2X7_FOLCA|nr:heterochromatin protein 1 [Folsomia candida]XP_035700615.1 heterochromatin protein 1 [Folsomia candida]OXA39001.1 Heterochromatin protein 1 [Folsomia candida]
MCPPVLDPGCARCINWRTHSPTKPRPPTTSRNNSASQNGYSNGFEEGLEVEAILGARDSDSGIFYLIKWKEREDLELMPALLTFFHVPALVIHFYADRISWISADS